MVIFCASEYDFRTHLLTEPRRADQRLLSTYNPDYPSLPPQCTWDHYADDHVTTLRTFQYIFQKFKKGILVQIRSGRAHMISFVNADFVNEWSDRIHHDPRYTSWSHLFRESCRALPYAYSSHKTHLDPQYWYANNGLIRYEKHAKEHDSEILTAFEELFGEVAPHLPDMDFFVNRRDFPLLHRYGCEPYTALFGPSQPLLSHAYPSYSPMLGMCSSIQHADIPMPTYVDWNVSGEEGIGEDVVPWEDRQPCAVWRGSSTGLGTTPEMNPRLKLAMMGRTRDPDSGELLLDAGLTKLNTRPRKHEHAEYFDTLQGHYALVPFLTPKQQQQFKYIVCVDGHSRAFRLGRDLASGSVVLLSASDYRLWFEHWLRPYEHYVPVNGNLDNLLERIRWCREHDEECAQIARNAARFYADVCSRAAICRYTIALLGKVAALTRTSSTNALSPSLCARYRTMMRGQDTPYAVMTHTCPWFVDLRGYRIPNTILLQHWVQECATKRTACKLMTDVLCSFANFLHASQHTSFWFSAQTITLDKVFMHADQRAFFVDASFFENRALQCSKNGLVLSTTYPIPAPIWTRPLAEFASNMLYLWARTNNSSHIPILLRELFEFFYTDAVVRPKTTFDLTQVLSKSKPTQYPTWESWFAFAERYGESAQPFLGELGPADVDWNAVECGVDELGRAPQGPYDARLKATLSGLVS